MSKQSGVSKVLLVAVLGLFIGVSAHAATFFNGDFESPGVLNTSSFGSPDPGAVVPGVRYVGDSEAFPDGSWTHTGTATPATRFGDFYTNGVGFNWLVPTQNPVGGNYFGFGASGATGGTLEQTFDTDVGVTYIVTYWLTTQELAGDSLPLQQAYVEARDGSGPGANTLGSQLNLLTQAAGWFQGQSLTFTATTTSTTLRFIDQTDADLVGNAAFMVNWGLDNVAVDVATPEPGTYGMLALGLGALALFRKRRLLH